MILILFCLVIRQGWILLCIIRYDLEVEIAVFLIKIILIIPYRMILLRIILTFYIRLVVFVHLIRGIIHEISHIAIVNCLRPHLAGTAVGNRRSYHAARNHCHKKRYRKQDCSNHLCHCTFL